MNKTRDLLANLAKAEENLTELRNWVVGHPIYYESPQNRQAYDGDVKLVKKLNTSLERLLESLD